MEDEIEYIRELVSKGGPDRSEYDKVYKVVRKVYNDYKRGNISEDELEDFRDAFGESLSKYTIQGFAYQKPHGHPGDFEIMEMLYNKHISSKENLKKWDEFINKKEAPKAVRNRKEYFKNILNGLSDYINRGEKERVLNMACDPARTVYEFLKQKPNSNINFDCVDADENAIEYAKELCSPYLDKIKFHESNVFNFSSDRRYRLIWSAGLFDYLNDREFNFLLERAKRMCSDSGEIIIGNFSEANPTRPYMEAVSEWVLYHRSETDIIDIAIDCGIPIKDIRVEKEDQEVNLFLRIKFGSSFIEKKEL